MPRLCGIAAMACHLFRQKFSPVGNGLQLFMNLIAIPAGGPQMPDGCLAFRHRHAASHLGQAGRGRWPRGRAHPEASSPPWSCARARPSASARNGGTDSCLPPMISHPSTRQGHCGSPRIRLCQRRSAGSAPSAAARCQPQDQGPDPAPAYSPPIKIRSRFSR